MSVESVWRWFLGYPQLKRSLPQIIFSCEPFGLQADPPQGKNLKNCFLLHVLLDFTVFPRTVFSPSWWRSPLFLRSTPLSHTVSLESRHPGFVSASSSDFFCLVWFWFFGFYCLHLVNALIIQGPIISTIGDVLEFPKTVPHALGENLFLVYFQHPTFSLSLITSLTVFSP